MANEQPQKKIRRLRQAPQTMRERAVSVSNKHPKQSRPRSIVSKASIPFHAAGSRIGKLHIWKPFRVIGHIITRLLVPPYIRNSLKELRLVTWPDRRQTFQLTGAVILFSIIFGILVGLFDFGLDKLFKQVILR